MNSGNYYNIKEIYYTIQGESGYSGFPCVMLRFAECNIRCNYCDTPEALTAQDGRLWKQEKLLEKIYSYPCKLIEFTGGEPLVQKGLPELSRILLSEGYTILIESNGTYDISLFPKEVIFILDVKCPDSGAGNTFLVSNLTHISAKDELKYVLSSYDDYTWSVGFIKQHNLQKKCSHIFSPVWGRVEPRSLAEWMLKDGLEDIRMQIQLHKIIWGPKAKGV